MSKNTPAPAALPARDLDARDVNGVAVFAATMQRDREAIGERVTSWLRPAQATPGFQLLGIQTLQSSDNQFHCVTIIVTYWSENAIAPPPAAERGERSRT